MARVQFGTEDAKKGAVTASQIFTPSGGIFYGLQAIGRIGGKKVTEALSKKLVSEGGKEFSEQAYSTTVRVMIKQPKLGGGFTRMVDEVKGLNQSHALQRAEANWPGSQISLLNTFKKGATSASKR